MKCAVRETGSLRWSNPYFKAWVKRNVLACHLNVEKMGRNLGKVRERWFYLVTVP